MTLQPESCPLCRDAGGTVLCHNENLRIIAVDDDNHPGLTRVIWQEHIAEMTQLPPLARNALMEAVWRVELAQRQILQPDKVNLAQFGNMVPHLHWHVIPRWAGDSHFPDAIWAAAPARSAEHAAAWAQHKARIRAALPQYWETLQKCCNATT